MSLEYRASHELNSITGKGCFNGSTPYTTRKMRVKCWGKLGQYGLQGVQCSGKELLNVAQSPLKQ